MGLGVPGDKSPQQEEQEGTKRCSKCGKTKAVSEWGKNRRRRDGLQSQCKACMKAYREHRKEYYAEYTRQWRANNPDYGSEYYQANKDAISRKASEWAKNNKDRTRAAKQRRRASKANARGSFSAHDWKQKLAYYGYKCRFCGIHKNDTPEGWLEADHAIPLSRGGTNWISNIVPACKSCNCSKGVKTFKEFMEYLNGK